MNNRCFALVDCNNFFVSCERVFKPSLKNKPVIILSSNDGCVISRSNEAKALGIEMGVPYFQIKDFCIKNNIHIFSSNLQLYTEISTRIMHIIREYVPRIEVYSIDEAFLDLTGFENHVDDYCNVLIDKIEKYTGIPVSIGVGKTKTLAKLANYAAKKINKSKIVKLLEQKNIDQILKKTAIEDIWGIGHKTAIKLKIIGIGTAKDLALAPSSILKNHFNINVAKTSFELNNISCMDIAAPKASKSITTSRSFGINVTQIEDLEEAISTYVTRAAIKLREQNLYTSSIHVYLETTKKDGSQIFSCSNILSEPTNHTPTLISESKNIINKIHDKKYKYKKCGIVMMDLIDINSIQPNLFTQKTHKKNDVLMKIIDGINKKFGGNAIIYASCGTKQQWKMKQNFLSSHSIYHLEQIPSVT